MQKRDTGLEKTEASDSRVEIKDSIEGKSLFYALFNQANDSIFLMDPASQEGPVIIDVNEFACAVHGYTREELIGKPISLLDDREATKEIPQRTIELMSGKASTFEAGHVRKDGSTLVVEVSAQVITIGNKPYILAIDRDITERKRIEKELKGRVKELEKFYEIAIGRELKMKEQQEEIERLKSKLSDYKNKM